MTALNTNGTSGEELTTQSRPKVLFLVSEDRFFWSHRLPVARAAIRNGYDVTVATRVETYGQQIRQEGFHLIPLKLIRKSNSPVSEFRAIQELRRIYREIRPDFVHHFALKPVLYGSIAALGRRDIVSVNALTGLGYLVASRSWKARFIRLLLWNAFRFFLNRPNQRVVVENQDDKQLLASKVKVPPEKIMIIRGSGVDTDAFEALPEPAGVPVVLLASRMVWIKGVQEFVDAARILRGQSVSARFVLAGDTDPHNPSCIPRAQLLEWQASGLVEWWGQQHDMVQTFKQANIVCLPSHGGEGVPQVLLEAAACARTIVTTDVPGCRDVVRHDYNGKIVQPRDAMALAQAIRGLLDDPAVRKQMGAYSRKIALEQFSQTLVLNQIMSLYGELSDWSKLQFASARSRFSTGS